MNEAAHRNDMSPRKEVLAEGVEWRRVKPCMAPQSVVTIYALCDPVSGIIRYVGKTRYTPERRLTYHLTQARRSRLPSANWLRSMSSRGQRPILVPLETVGLNADWESREKFWIAACRASGFPILNLTDGGDGPHGFRPSEQHRARISDALKTGAEFKCQVCAQPFWRKLSAIRKGENKFCSKACYAVSLKGTTRQIPASCTMAGVAAAALAKLSQAHCKRGHPLSGDNLFHTSSGARGCKECRKIHKLTYRAKINACMA